MHYQINLYFPNYSLQFVGRLNVSPTQMKNSKIKELSFIFSSLWMTKLGETYKRYVGINNNHEKKIVRKVIVKATAYSMHKSSNITQIEPT